MLVVSRRIGAFKLARLTLASLLALGAVLTLVRGPAMSQAGEGTSVAGRILDAQGQPVSGAHVEITDPGDTLLGEAESQEDGTFVADLEGSADEVVVSVSRPHFHPATYEVNPQQVAALDDGEGLRVPDLTLEREVNAGFWFASLTFVAILLLMALERLHTTTAALFGAALLFLASFILTPIWPDLFIFDFERGLSYIDFEVIFLIMGMMIVIGTVEGTGIFQWLTYMAYRLSRGRVQILVVILIVITSLASATLDNVTTMLLMTPITLEIALALGINPLSLLIPEILASNVGGISTLVGTPTNILIGSFADISFNDFLVNLTPGVILSLVALTVYVQFVYRKQYRAAGLSLSPVLARKLEQDAQIRDRPTLIKSGVVFAGILILFVLGERFHLVPAVTALMGATAILLWVDLEVEGMLRAVNWTTLVFFMALFILVGAVREVGLISLIAQGIGNLIGHNLTLGIIIFAAVIALFSVAVANIPLAAAMLPVVGFLTRTVPGAESKVLFYSLSVGVAMGGNGSLVGGETNVITAGIAQRAGYTITFGEFLKVGLPSVLVTVVVGTIWLLIRFL